jgi:hypothetical protein
MAGHRWLLALLIFLFLAGCSPSLQSGATHINGQTLSAHLVAGQTSRQEVYRHFGPPQSRMHPSQSSRSFFAPNAGRHPQYPDTEIWTYSARSIAQASALDPRPIVHHQMTLRLFFDHSGILQDYAVLELQN